MTQVTDRHRKLAEHLVRPTDSFVSPPGAMTDARAQAIAATEARIVARMQRELDSGCLACHDQVVCGACLETSRWIGHINGGDY